VHGATEEWRGDAAVVLLVVHQRYGTAFLEACEQLLGAVPALGREQAHAIARPAGLDAGVHVRIVGRAIGDLAGDAGRQDRGGHDLPVGKVSRDEHHRRLAGGDALQPLTAHHLDAPALGRQAVHHREFEEHPTDVVPLLAQKGAPPRVIHLREGQAQIAFGGAMVARQWPDCPGQGRAEIGRRVDRQGADQGGEQIKADRFHPPRQILDERRAGLGHASK